MITFMIGVLSSVLFWAGFFGVGLFATAIMIKLIAPKTYRYITTGKVGSCDSVYEYGWLGFALFLVWPFVLIALIIGFICRTVFKSIFKNMFKAIYKTIPTIKFEKEDA